MSDVYLEQGRTWTFACALDWPGWARRGKGEQAALEALRAYADRYAAVVPGFSPGELHVVGRVQGTATTDFGAPDARGPWDEAPVDLDREADLLQACWAAFDGVVAGSPLALRLGPRGGGRDRDGIAAHVREGERTYGRKLGPRVPPRTPWAEQRAEYDAAVRAGAPDGRWPVRYAVRRFAWHVLDHAWEVQDRVLPDRGATPPARSGGPGPR